MIRSRSIRLLATGAILTGIAGAGCAGRPGAHLAEERARIEERIQAEHLGSDPHVEAARHEVEAAIAMEAGAVAIDGVEIRAGVVHEKDEKMQALLRVPIQNLAELHEEKKVRRAQSETALARLGAAGLEQRAARCRPALEAAVFGVERDIYAEYERQHRALLEWNRELRNGGLINEVAARRFELSSGVRLATRVPHDRRALAAREAVSDPSAHLPVPSPGASPLRTDPELIQSVLQRHQPTVAIHRARRREFLAMEKRERSKRLPSLRFVDVGFEPVAYSGDDRAIEARVAFEVPFGRGADAASRHYGALARAERSRERGLLALRREDALRALGEINEFRDRADHWVALESLARASQSTAERWWKSRLASPSEIAKLLDSVYSARVAILGARRRAGQASCAIIEATGLSVSEWPG